MRVSLHRVHSLAKAEVLLMRRARIDYRYTDCRVSGYITGEEVLLTELSSSVSVQFMKYLAFLLCLQCIRSSVYCSGLRMLSCRYHACRILYCQIYHVHRPAQVLPSIAFPS